MNPLGIIPTYLAETADLALLIECVESLLRTAAGRVDIQVVDDCSPAPELLDQFEEHFSGVELGVIRKPENTGFSKTVNMGLEIARATGRDAILINADIEFDDPRWLDAMLGQQNLHSDGPAAVVGALLCYPNGLIQHAGIYFSLLTRTFDHLHKFGPMNLPAARAPRSCPVTGALQLVRHETLMEVGLYDEEFSMGFEDVDYCLRVFLAGRECVYAPDAVAFHHESVFRGRGSDKVMRWQQESWAHLATKYANVDMATLVPFL